MIKEHEMVRMRKKWQTCFLVITWTVSVRKPIAETSNTFKTSRHIVMNNISHVRFIYPHTECGLVISSEQSFRLFMICSLWHISERKLRDLFEALQWEKLTTSTPPSPLPPFCHCCKVCLSIDELHDDKYNSSKMCNTTHLWSRWYSLACIPAFRRWSATSLHVLLIRIRYENKQQKSGRRTYSDSRRFHWKAVPFFHVASWYNPKSYSWEWMDDVRQQVEPINCHIQNLKTKGLEYSDTS
jgi:hypothetical protein